MRLLVWVSLVCSSCIIVYKLVKKLMRMCKQYEMLKNVPGPPIDNIILGNSRVILSSPTELVRMCKAKFTDFGRMLRLWICGFPFVFVARADYAEVFFNSKHTSTKADVYKFLHDWLGLGLLTSGGPLWHQRRKLISPAFHFSILNTYIDIFIANSLTLVRKLQEYPEGASIDVFKMIHLVALDNICETAMGIKIDALNNPKMEYITSVENATETIMDRIKKPWFWNDASYFLLPIGRKLKKSLEMIHTLSDNVIKNKRIERATRGAPSSEPECDVTGVKRKLAFLDLLMEASESEAVLLTDKDLRDEVNTFMFEGHDTTAVSMSFILYLLGLHPEVQEKCREELDSIFQDSDRKPTTVDLQNMKYLEQVIKEGLRLYPSVPLVSRQVTQDVKMGKYVIPEGTILTLSIFHLHRDPRYFPDPEKFDPGRFSAEKIDKRPPYAYTPFAAGPRNCIGQKFAMMEEKIVLSYVLRNFILEASHEAKQLRPIFSLILRTHRSLSMKFTPRKRDKKSEEISEDSR